MVLTRGATARLVVMAAVLSVVGQEVSAQSEGAVCGDPTRPCPTTVKKFAPYELGFYLPRTVRDNTACKSARFFAVVVKTVPLTDVDECDQGEYSSKIERERRQIQSRFPHRKVFASNQCPDMNAVSYIVNGKPDTTAFIAIYGGATRAEAQQVRARIALRYPKAAVKPMQAVWERIMQ